MTVFSAIDFETADNGRDSACAVAVVMVENDNIIHRYSRLIRPPRKKILFTSIHGITWDDVKDEPRFKGIWPELKEIINNSDFLVAHNAPFDRSVLNACCESARVAVPKKRFACTVQASRKVWDLPSHSLPVVCEHLDIELNHHDALSDAEASALIAILAMENGVKL